MSKKISVGIISSQTTPTVTEELAVEIGRRGHAFTQVIFDRVDYSDALTTIKEKDLLSFDVLYYRTGLGNVWARELEQYLRDNNHSAINLDIVDHPYRNHKTQQMLVAAKTDSLVPKTIADTVGNYNDIERALGSKFIVKADIGSQGADVHLVSSEAELVALGGNLAEKEHFYQEYLPHDHDFRIHLIGGKAMAAYKRIPVAGDFRTNVSRGGSMNRVEDSVKKILYPEAEKIAAALGLNICAVDFLERKTDNAYFFVETNINPGWETSDIEATGVDMSAAVVDYFEELVG